MYSPEDIAQQVRDLTAEMTRMEADEFVAELQDLLDEIGLPDTEITEPLNFDLDRGVDDDWI